MAKTRNSYRKGKLLFKLGGKTDWAAEAKPVTRPFNPLLWLVIALFFLASIAAMAFTLQQFLKRQVLERAATVARLLASHSEDAVLTSNAVQLKLYARSASSIPGVVSVTIVDAEGKIAAGPQWDLVGKPYASEPGAYLQENGITYREQENAKGDQIEVVEAIHATGASDSVVGKVYLTTDASLPWNEWRQDIMEGGGIFLAGLVLLITGLLLAWRLRFRALAAQLRQEFRRNALIDLLKESREEVLHVTVVERSRLQK